MANLSKKKRDQMIAFLESLKESHSDDASIQAFNEIENHIRDKKYGLVWEEHSEEVDDLLKENIPILTADPERRLCKDASLPWNFIIEGDNLQALYLLEKTHKGKVDCIYIDPPYNTGARDWKYNNDYVDNNDSYRHSKWLSMMRNRLLIAKQLLNPLDSVLIITIDDVEVHTLVLLLQELFPESYIQSVSCVINPSGKVGNGFSVVHEYIVFVFVGDARINNTSNDMLFAGNAATEVTKGTFAWESLLRRGSSWNPAARPNLFYPVLVDPSTEEIMGIGEPTPPAPDMPKTINGYYAAWPIKNDGSYAIWRVDGKRLSDLVKKGYAYVSGFDQKRGTYAFKYLMSGDISRIESGEVQIERSGKHGEVEMVSSYQRVKTPKTVWNVSSHNAGMHGSDLLTRLIGRRGFSFPKSLYAVRDTLRFFVANKPDAIIVDFFAGSGTTFHAVNLLNAEDNGTRRCIMATNNEVSITEAKNLKAKGYKPGDEEWEKYGIARYVTWPRSVCSIEGKDVTGKVLKGNYISDNILEIPLSNGFNANVKYFKCSWTPRKPEDYLLSNALCLHIKEMIELQNAIEVDNVKNVLILNKEDFKRTILNVDVRPHIERVWVNQNIIFSTEELKALKEKGYKYIPREFFGQELKEAAE